MWCQCSQEFHNGILLSPSWSPHYTGWSYWLGIRKRHIMGLSFKTLMGFKDWANNLFKTEEHIISIKKDGLVGEGEPIMHSWRHCNTFLWRLKEYIKFHATIFSKKALWHSHFLCLINWITLYTLMVWTKEISNCFQN